MALAQEQIIARNVHCKGDEVSFVDCGQMEWFPGGCSHREDIGLWCQPPTDHDVLTNKCTEKCVPGFFEGKNKICELCNRKCLTCTGGPDNCLTCRNPYFHNGTTCALTCPDGKYPNTTLRVCRPCTAECRTCGGREDNCLSCVRPLLHNGSHCGKKCPAGVYRKEYSCVRDCGLRHYPNHKDGVCHACRLGCLVCSEYSKCTACEHGFVSPNKAHANRAVHQVSSGHLSILNLWASTFPCACQVLKISDTKDAWKLSTKGFGVRYVTISGTVRVPR